MKKDEAIAKVCDTVEKSAGPVESVLLAMRELHNALIAIREKGDSITIGTVHWALLDHQRIALHDGDEIIEWNGTCVDQAYTIDAVLQLFEARFPETRSDPC